jgi:hypothetical protein
VDGLSSIWSLTREYPAGKLERCLTVEVTDAGAVGQIRGFANRRAGADEMAMLRRWADDYDLALEDPSAL